MEPKLHFDSLKFKLNMIDCLLLIYLFAKFKFKLLVKGLATIKSDCILRYPGIASPL